MLHVSSLEATEALTNLFSHLGSPLLWARKASRWISENYTHPLLTEYIKTLASDYASLSSESVWGCSVCLYLGLRVVVEAGVEKRRH